MHELSHTTSAKRMTDVRAVLRQDLHGGRNRSQVSFGVRLTSAARCANWSWLNGLDESAGCRAFSHLA